MKQLMKGLVIVLTLLALFSCQQGMMENQLHSPISRAINPGFEGNVSLKAHSNDLYVSHQSGDRLVAQSSTEAVFTMIPMGGNNVAFKSSANGKYLCAELDGTMVANRDAIDLWETFELISLGNDNFAIKALSNGKYVCADRSLDGLLVADRDEIQEWETFTIKEAGNYHGSMKAQFSYDHWGGSGYQGYINIINESNQPVSDWELTFDSPNINLNEFWGANIEKVGNSYKVTPSAGSAAIPANGGRYPEITYLVYGSGSEASNISITGGEPVIPNPPANVQGTAGDGIAVISWDSSYGADSYNVYRSTTSGTGTAGTKLEDVNSPFTDQGLTNGTIYYYVVTAENQAGESDASGETSVRPEVPPVPQPPTNLSLSAGSSQIAVNWSASQGATSYNIYYSTIAGQARNGSHVDGITGTSYTITGLTNGTIYYVCVTAENGSGESTPTAEESATPIPNDDWNNPAIGDYLYGIRTNASIVNQTSENWTKIIPPAGVGMDNMCIYNNLWGTDSYEGSPNHGTGSGTIFDQWVGDTYSFGWAWDFRSLKSNQVISYQSVCWGYSPNAKDWFNGETPIYQVGDNKTYTTTFDMRRTNRSGAWNTAFDIWLYLEEHPTSKFGAERSGFEIMIWFDYETQGPWGDYSHDVTINGHRYKVYDNHAAGGWRVISYLYQDRHSAPIEGVEDYNLTNFYDDCLENFSDDVWLPADPGRYGDPEGGLYRGFSTDHYINAVEFGSESCGGGNDMGNNYQGMFELKNYSLDILD